VTSRKKNLLLIQITIFLIASGLLYNTYRNKNVEVETVIKQQAETAPNTNSFTDIEYSGFDLTGNRYVIKAERAEFKTVTPEIINMKEVFAKFYLKDNTILTVVSDETLYNNVTLDMDFKKNVKSDYLTHTLFSDLLSYSNSKGKLIATGNVRGESIEKGEFIADNVEYDLTEKVLKLSMFGNKRVNMKIEK
jgi:hypothetical protein